MPGLAPNQPNPFAAQGFNGPTLAGGGAAWIPPADAAAPATAPTYKGTSYSAGLNPNVNAATYSQGDPSVNQVATTNDPNSVAQWEIGQSGNKPWESRAASAADTRNNFYYGGSATGASDFNGGVQTAQGQLSGNYGQVGAQANALGTNAFGMQQAAAARAPGQFLDQQDSANNATDRSSQMGAVQGLNRYIANGPGPSAAQAQLTQATNANDQNSLALARSGRGMGQSQAGMQQAIAGNAVNNQQAANQSAQLAAQENQNWQANQLNAYNQIGGISGAARQGDTSQAIYITGSQQNAQNANDAASVQYGNQALSANQQALGAVSGNSQNIYAGLGLQNNVNGAALSGNENYESNLLNYYTHNQAQAQIKPGTNYAPYIQAGGEVLGTVAAL